MTKARLPSRTVSKSTRYTLLTPFTLMQRTHHTNTKVMAKKFKEKQNPIKEGGVLHAIPNNM